MIRRPILLVLLASLGAAFGSPARAAGAQSPSGAFPVPAVVVEGDTAKIPVTCTLDTPCIGRLALSAACPLAHVAVANRRLAPRVRLYGSGTVRVAAGSRGVVVVHLSRAAVQELSRQSTLASWATIQVPKAGETMTFGSRIVLRAPSNATRARS